MAVATATTLDCTNASDAQFRAWANVIKNILNAGGWVQTSDAGQLDIDAATAPASNTDAGYQIWRTNDGLANVYVKFTFGTGSTANTPRLKVQVGWGTNGSGTLTGSPSTEISLTINSVANAKTYYVSADTNRLTLAMFSDHTSYWTLNIERTRDANGAEKANEVHIYTGSITVIKHQIVPSSGSLPAQDTSAIVAQPLSAANALYGGNVGVGLIFGCIGALTNPLCNLFTYYPANIGAGGSVTISVYGSNKTYKAVGGNLQPTGVSGIAGLIRYE